MNKKRLAQMLAAILILLSTTITATAKTPKPITLRYAAYLPLEHPIIVVHKRWLRNVEAATKGRLVFQEFHGGSLIGPRAGAQEIKKGTSDIGSINCPAEAAQFPISSKTLAFFFGAKDSHTNIDIYKTVLYEFPEWIKEFEGLKPLCFQTAGPFNLVSKVPIRTLNDFKGLQIRTIGPYLKHTLKSLGASPVAIPASEVYISLQKNIVDAVTKGDDAVKSNALAEVAKYTILLNLQEGSGNLLVMNQNSFNKLPLDIQKIIDASLPALQEDYLQTYAAYVESARDFAKQHDHEWVSLSADAQAKIEKLLDEEARMSVAKLDSEGLPGTAIYTRIRELVEKTK